MQRMKKLAAAMVAMATAAGGGLMLADRQASAADHNEPGSRVNTGAADKANDIADIYVFPVGDKLVLVDSFAGPGISTRPGVYDRDALYTILISNDADPLTIEVTIEIRFARDANGNWGVQLKNVPGAAGVIEGPVQKTLTSGTAKVVAGLYDDPFFFDSQGLSDTRVAGDLRFRSDRDFFARTNDTMIILEFPQSAIRNGNNPLQVSVHSARVRAGL